MPYNSETGLYERRSTTVIDATPDGDTVAVAIDTKLDQATDDAVTDLNHHDANGNHYPDTTVTTTKQYLAKSPAGSVSWANGVPLDEAVESTLLAASTGSTLVGHTGGVTLKDKLDALDVADAARPTSETLAASGGSDLVGFLQDGTGAVARTAQDKMRDVVSVKDFGAVGDGVTDDTDAIQAAFDSAIGVVIYLPGSMTYKIASNITIPDGAHVYSDGNAIIKSYSNANINIGSGCFIENIHFDLNSGDGQVLFDGVSDTSVSRCRAYSGSANGFFVYNGGSGITFEMCKSYNNAYRGFYITGTEYDDLTNVRVVGCVAYGNGRDGIFVAGSGQDDDTGKIQNLATYINVSGCNSYTNGTSNAYSGITVANCQFVCIASNTCHQNQEHGISIQEVYDFSVSGNACFSNIAGGGLGAQSGLNPHNPTKNGSVSGNSFNNNGYGVVLTEITENIVFCGNTMLGNTLYSVRTKDIGASGLKSDSLIFVGNDMHPSSGSTFVNSNASTRINFLPSLNNIESGNPISLNRLNYQDIDSTLTLDVSGTTVNQPEVFFVNNTGTDIARTSLNKAIRGARITLIADATGGFRVRHNQGDGITYAGFILQAATTVTFSAYQSKTFIADGTNWIEIATN